jgi:hypothetical protein
MAEEAKSNAVVIKHFFCPDMKAGAFIGEFKALTEEDRQQLGDGIRDGSLTY